ncbi:PD-(D/E)XK nuclease family protein [Larkinella humicola]|uniref:PD-(D/E)XK nuclease family protein n=1 Tax=Larkinella humicola TaxID=2607654 RepID=A0A5N1JLJ0_9BACT|nr:PD-(D/E)XK nuclease family protein [Larkinella humicola]KAA9357355.1 PD-(D/E)XK nuclease family protein [Larkinella humicola]
MSFLRQVAQHIFRNHQTRMDDVWVIVPTRRAVSTFQQHLSQQSDTPFLSPHVLAVDDFIMQSAGVLQIDPVSLLFELFEVFKEIDDTLEFGRFLNWASILLTDFDRIDQYMISPSELFSYMTAAKALERWRLDLPDGRGGAKLETVGTQRYFKLFENLQTAYEALHERLLSKGWAYRGMAYRLLANQVEDLVRDNPAYEKLYFVGFNALSRSEEQIVKTLLKAQKAEMLWDTDAYYMQSKRQEAGKMLRNYKRDGWSGPWTWEGNGLTETPKHIQVIGVPNASMQAKVASQIYRQHADSETDAGTTALILGDETLLLPVLYSMGGSVTDLNVTMGLSLQNSHLFTLVDALFEMQRTVAAFQKKDGSGTIYIPKFNHRHVVKVLNHPFIRQYELTGLKSSSGLPNRVVQKAINTITTDNLVYLDEKQLLAMGENSPLFQVLFRRWPDDKPLVVIHQFYALIEVLREVYTEQQDAIETEYLYLFQNLLRQLETTLEREQRNELVTIKSLKQFLYELIRQTSIPFESEGGSALQVMGMLETRALDFEHLIILSVNEGILPQSRKLNSLIPFDACVEVGLPTYQDQESVMSYHFYRLLQRARKVSLLYVTSADAYGTSKGEKSRFIRQIEHELVPASGGNVTISYPTVRFGKAADQKLALLPYDTLEIPKSDAILAKLREDLMGKFSSAKNRVFGGMYPTSLNNFMSCSLKYYFSRVISMQEDDEVSDEMDAAEFGQWIHNTLEALDQEYRMVGAEVTTERVVEKLKLKYEEAFVNRVTESGMNRLLYKVAEDLMVRFNALQMERYGKNLEVLQTEEEWDTELEVETAIGPLRIRIAGKIDRVERLRQPDGTVLIRVADYKTGKIEARDADVKTMELLLTDAQKDKARQLWLYQYLVYKKMLQNKGLQFGSEWIDGTNTRVVAGFYSFRNMEGGFMENKLHLGTPEEFVVETEVHLRKLIADLFDPGQPFQKTSDKKICEWCEYRKLCGR